MSRETFGAKSSAETIKQVFDFVSRLAVSETISTAAVTATVHSGTDASPSSLISGSASISGTKVTQTLTAGIEGVTYLLTCTVTTSAGQTLILAGYINVVPADYV